MNTKYQSKNYTSKFKTAALINAVRSAVGIRQIKLIQYRSAKAVKRV